MKRDCPTCELVAPALAELAAQGPLTIYSQDDPGFPEGLAARDDSELTASWQCDIEAVPTLLRVEAGREVERAVGCVRDEWRALTGVASLVTALPAYRPGCGSLSVDPERAPALAVRFGDARLARPARRAGHR